MTELQIDKINITDFLPNIDRFQLRECLNIGKFLYSVSANEFDQAHFLYIQSNRNTNIFTVITTPFALMWIITIENMNKEEVINKLQLLNTFL